VEWTESNERKACGPSEANAPNVLGRPRGLYLCHIRGGCCLRMSRVRSSLPEHRGCVSKKYIKKILCDLFCVYCATLRLCVVAVFRSPVPCNILRQNTPPLNCHITYTKSSFTLKEFWRNSTHSFFFLQNFLQFKGGIDGQQQRHSYTISEPPCY
jgi:hypothetical protein